MIGNNQVDALIAYGSFQPPAKARVPVSTLIDQPRAGRSRTLDHITAQVVTLTNAVRHMKVGTSPTKLNCCLLGRHIAVVPSTS